ncbi:N-acetyltransferase [Lysinibacillus sphaericus]|uniref:Acetyltransferase (GNAT) family n=1 Tax=Lysinibacillus sphaericus TaxID=1421 RepID=A0A2S0JVR3_LYSSH|nr:GNAT family N-acetyltransferase [Lysinibacillus sphaericus]AVK95233.1 N-acetyltransferase [Lysinibacillus sphaericus]MED4545123.1 GNAT family N-acetyltransferase [Lysinibacillus sphaericus]TKI18592.1 N-acetyltransferase [Lysinibacillus sphaericus]SUV19309.1 Acetyltransferase (GNAT) family [Lysinibacillus sphaericus]GEC82895.1 N-acetyltransferase [Lysinibacillus sphaericus]
MEFQLQKVAENKLAFVYKQDGEQLAEITWKQEGQVMVMDHTYVSDKLRGQGVAKKLLDRAADYARENNYKMVAVCSYVVATFEKSDAYDDVKQ